MCTRHMPLSDAILSLMKLFQFPLPQVLMLHSDPFSLGKDFGNLRTWVWGWGLLCLKITAGSLCGSNSQALKISPLQPKTLKIFLKEKGSPRSLGFSRREYQELLISSERVLLKDIIGLACTELHQQDFSQWILMGFSRSATLVLFR